MLIGEGTAREISYNFNTESFVEFLKTEEKQLKKCQFSCMIFHTVHKCRKEISEITEMWTPKTTVFSEA